MNRNLQRYPYRKNDLLQAWDSADELLLAHLSVLDLLGKRLLLVNDSFGALSANLLEHDLSVLTDSFISCKATQINTGERVAPVNSFQDLRGPFDLVVIRVPKNLSYFEDLLCHLTHLVKPGSQLVCGAMVKHLPAGAFDLIQKYVGEPHTSLAQKKARLIFAKFVKGPAFSPYPLSVRLDGFEKEFVNHSNLFSRDRLDIGSRFLLEHMPTGDFRRILDLGCGNGVIGIRAKQLMPRADLFFSDESAMAIASARENYTNHFGDDGAHFLWTNCLEEGTNLKLDLVLCNPPFHQGHVVGDFIAGQMFRDARAGLREGGVLRVIGNSHLAYPQKLKSIFGNCRIIATNQKFVIVDSVKS